VAADILFLLRWRPGLECVQKENLQLFQQSGSFFVIFFKFMKLKHFLSIF